MYKARRMTHQQPFEVHLHPHVTVDVADVFDELEYGHYTLQEPEANLPLGVFEALPVGSRRVITLNIQVETHEKMSIVITGSTWSFRERFDATHLFQIREKINMKT